VRLGRQMSVRRDAASEYWGPHRCCRPQKNSDFGRRIEMRRSVKGALTSDAVGTLNWKRDGDAVASVAFRLMRQRLFSASRSPCCGALDLEQQVTLSSVPLALGDSREYFLCRRAECGRRVILHIAGDVFRCRRCHGLAYLRGTAIAAKSVTTAAQVAHWARLFGRVNRRQRRAGRPRTVRLTIIPPERAAQSPQR
jgi:hypothetical protein